MNKLNDWLLEVPGRAESFWFLIGCIFGGIVVQIAGR